MTKGNVEELTKRVANTELTDAEKFAITLCTAAYTTGGNWGFLKASAPDYKSTLVALQGNKNIRLIQVSNGALILVNRLFIANAVNKVVPGGINNDYMAVAEQRRGDERLKFEKLISRIAKGETQSGVHTEGGKRIVTVGIYSKNETNKIVLNGVDYPAFRLTAEEAVEFGKGLIACGKGVYVSSMEKNPAGLKQRWLNINPGREEMHSENVAAIFRGLSISDTDTGVFISFKID